MPYSSDPYKPPISFVRQGRQPIATRTVMDAQANANSYNYPARVRPNEPGRKVCIVRNLGSTSAQIGYGTNANDNYNGPSSWSITLAPGQEYVEPSGTSAPFFFRPATSGQAARIEVYVDMGAQ